MSFSKLHNNAEFLAHLAQIHVCVILHRETVAQGPNESLCLSVHRQEPRGFAIKFYTGEGNYDIVGLNFPILFCRDPIQGPDIIRSQGRRPDNFLLDYNATFDLLANNPEGNHAGIMFFSDHDHPKGWRFNHGYGCYTFEWVNLNGEFVYIKYHFISD
ncbi:hypothetical protein LTR70_010491 [Exophiala xenobiotica]|nr:hypothetical protein LTR70_010491 [Exophiala xenobiotica]